MIIPFRAAVEIGEPRVNVVKPHSTAFLYPVPLQQLRLTLMDIQLQFRALCLQKHPFSICIVIQSRWNDLMTRLTDIGATSMNILHLIAV